MNNRLNALIESFPNLSSCQDEIRQAFDVLHEVYANGGKLLICGNGGSAADSDHMAGELLKGFTCPRPVDDKWKRKLGTNLSDKLQGALPTIPLTGFNAFNSAFNNDCDPYYNFAKLTWALGESGDSLFGLTGHSGGQLFSNVDVCIRAPASKVENVQEFHLPIYHCLCHMLEDAFFT